MKTCKNRNHLDVGAYKYTCKKCWHGICNKRKHPMKNGDWCHCECGHNTYICTKCWKPVAHQNCGLYWFVIPEDRVVDRPRNYRKPRKKRGRKL